MFRSRKTTKKYKGHKDSLCPFCHPEAHNVILETAHSRVIKNLFPYEYWEHRDVAEHYMVVPKRHVGVLAELTADEQADLMRVMAKYESEDFNIYARSNQSVERTVAHQHTHLIKTATKHAKAALYMRKPYIVAKI